MCIFIKQVDQIIQTPPTQVQSSSSGGQLQSAVCLLPAALLPATLKSPLGHCDCDSACAGTGSGQKKIERRSSSGHPLQATRVVHPHQATYGEKRNSVPAYNKPMTGRRQADHHEAPCFFIPAEVLASCRFRLLLRRHLKTLIISEKSIYLLSKTFFIHSSLKGKLLYVVDIPGFV